MAAYASLICLEQTVHRLQNSSQISFVPPSLEIVEYVNNELQSLQKTLSRLDRSSRRRPALWTSKLEDVLELQFSYQILSQSEETISKDGFQFSIDLQESEHEIHFLVETLKEMEQEYIQRLGNPNLLKEEQDDDDDDDGDDKIVVQSRIESKMIGFSDKFVEIKDRFKRVGGNHVVTPITGMARIVGRKWQLKEILLAILAQVGADMDEMVMDEEVKNIGDFLRERLKGKKHIIVLDDVWDKQLWNEWKNLFKDDDDNGGKILITTRLDHVVRGASNPSSKIVKCNCDDNHILQF